MIAPLLNQVHTPPDNSSNNTWTPAITSSWTSPSTSSSTGYLYPQPTWNPPMPLMSGMETSSTILKIAPALLKAQRKMGTAVKDAKNPFYKSKFADLNSVREAVLPALHEEGVIALQPTVVVEGRQYVRTLLLHESGEFLASDTEVLCAKQNDPQALGSAISYARRYSLQSFMNVGAEDSDAEGAMNRTPHKATASKVELMPGIPHIETVAATPPAEEQAPLKQLHHLTVKP